MDSGGEGHRLGQINHGTAVSPSENKAVARKGQQRTISTRVTSNVSGDPSVWQKTLLKIFRWSDECEKTASLTAEN